MFTKPQAVVVAVGAASVCAMVIVYDDTTMNQTLFPAALTSLSFGVGAGTIAKLAAKTQVWAERSTAVGTLLGIGAIFTLPVLSIVATVALGFSVAVWLRFMFLKFDTN